MITHSFKNILNIENFGLFFTSYKLIATIHVFLDKYICCGKTPLLNIALGYTLYFKYELLVK